MTTQARPGPDINAVIGNVLKYGVIVSTAIVLLGLIAMSVNQPSGFPSNLSSLVSSNYGRPTLSAQALFSGLAAGDGLYIVELGLLILLATPVVRVVTSVILFAAERDLTYVVVTLLVLGILMISIFVVGPAVASAG